MRYAPVFAALGLGLLAMAPAPELREPHRALELARRALDVTGGGNPAVLDTLAAALAVNGSYQEAVRAATMAATMARRAGLQGMAREIESRIPSYMQGHGWVLPGK